MMGATEVVGTTGDERSFLLQRVQPAMTGLIDGSSPRWPRSSRSRSPRTSRTTRSSQASRQPSARVSMAFSEGLSDTGDLRGRGNPYVRGAITGAGTFLGGILHALPFLISDYRAALVVAVIVIAFELVSLALIRWRVCTPGSCAPSPPSPSAEASSLRSARHSARRPDDRRPSAAGHVERPAQEITRPCDAEAPARLPASQTCRGRQGCTSSCCPAGATPSARHTRPDRS